MDEQFAVGTVCVKSPVAASAVGGSADGESAFAGLPVGRTVTIYYL